MTPLHPKWGGVLDDRPKRSVIIGHLFAREKARRPVLIFSSIGQAADRTT